MEEVIREGALRLLTSEASCDVILSCQGHRMMAHKVILSIASPLLRELLLEDVSQPTVLIFPDISGNTMSLMMDYIYTGKVAVTPTLLPEFVSVANLLKLQLDGEYLASFLQPEKFFDKSACYTPVQSEPSNFTSSYLERSVRCRRGRRMPSLMPINTFKRRKELFNRVFPSPWCPRGSPLLRDPREDCLGTTEIPSSLKNTQEDPNNNCYPTPYKDNPAQSEQMPYYFDSCSPCQTKKIFPKESPIVTSACIVEDANVKEVELSEEIVEDVNCVKLDETLGEESDKLKPFKCEDCGKGFSQLRNYKYHRSIHEGTKEFAARCPECGKTFNDKGYLSSHMKIHRDKKEYACPHCPKRFNQRVAYNMHLRIHTGVKPHECPTCGKSFSRKMLLKQHQRVHTGERPYICPECGKSFADRSNMSLHARLHTGVKPYACTLCPKSFTKKHHLKTHMNFHTGLKPYSCQNCSLAFSQSSNMRTHYKKCILKDGPGDGSQS